MMDVAKLRSGKGTLIGVGAIGVVILMGIAIAYVRANDEANAKPKSTVSANLGQAPGSDSYNQAYQAKFEQMVNEKLQRLDQRQDEREKAADEKQQVALQRMESTVQTAAAQLNRNTQASNSSNATMPAAPDQEAYKPNKIYSMREMSGGNTMNTETFLATPNDIRNNGTDSANTKTNTDAFIIPEAGWVKGRMLNGVIGTSDGDFRYTEILLSGNYYGPNNYVQNLDRCVVTGEARASLWERRFQIKPVSLSCTFPNGRNKTWKTGGYIVDAQDGIQGVNGHLINNAGNKLAASVGAGIVESAGSYYSQSATNSSIAPATGSISSVVVSPGKFLAGGAMTGAGKGMQDNLKDYYDLFRSSLQVGGGGEVTVHFTSTQILPDGGEAISTVRAAN